VLKSSAREAGLFYLKISGQKGPITLWSAMILVVFVRESTASSIAELFVPILIENNGNNRKETIMLNQCNKKSCRQMCFIAAAILIASVSAYLFVKIGPLGASADDDNQKQIKVWSEQAAKPSGNKQYKILHVISYHSPWEWTDSQLNGFQTALKDLNVKYDIWQMDAKRKSDETWLQEISEKIRKAVDTSKPDLIFGSDDAAQAYVAKYYVNSDIPIVFSAVNEEPAKYGFAGSKNVTGVLERIHYTATLRLLKKLVPNAQKVAILSDTGQMWLPIIESMKQQQNDLPDIKVVSFDVIPTFEEFKQKVLDYQDKVDAIGFLGVFEFKDETGKNVLLEDVLKWLQANSKLPDFSFWEDRVDKGTLCAVTVSGYAQGYQAGLLARSILLDGKSPSALEMTPTTEGIPVINLPTAKRLNINPSADVLLTARVKQSIALE
jgi:ABC-type uncharacterized transport system substrate-binding protein